MWRRCAADSKNMALLRFPDASSRETPKNVTFWGLGLGGGGCQTAYLCAPLRPLLWQESTRLYWIITPHWLRVVRAPASLIWQHRWPPPRAHWISDKSGGRGSLGASLSFFYVYSAVFSSSSSSLRVSECLSTYRHELFICTPLLQALILAFVWRRCQCAPGGSRFTASAGRCCHTCMSFCPPTPL